MKVLFVDFDTLRPDHLGCYGYRRNTSPIIDSIAREGVRFNEYYCSDAPCLPSRAALISGRFGIRNGIVGHGGTASDRRLTGYDRGMQDLQDTGNFNNIFRRAGMYTCSISTFPERHSAWWFSAGMNETFNEGSIGLESGEAVVPYALNWLDNNGTSRENWFLHVHLWDPHTPYRVPMNFGNPFEGDDLLDWCWIDEEALTRHKKIYGPHTVNELNMFNDNETPVLPRNPGRIDDLSGIRRVMDGYDCGIAYADYCLGQIVDKMKALGIYEDTAIILTGDHGENFGELGAYAEHGTADRPCCNIPFIIKWPGCCQGTVDNEFHYSLDFLPTLCDLLDVDKNEDWDGISFVDTLKTGAACGRESLVLSQMAHVCQRSARFGDWLYIRTVNDGFHNWDSEMLFNLKDDPYEQKDVKEKYPEICAKGAKIILDWVDENMKKNATQIDPMWTVYHEGGPFHAHENSLAVYEQRLRSTGREAEADELLKRHEKYAPKPVPSVPNPTLQLLFGDTK